MHQHVLRVLLALERRHALGGNFYEPTVLLDVTPGMRVAREETFGPIAPVFGFRTEQDAIRMANDTEFGLASYFYTRDLARSWRVETVPEVWRARFGPSTARSLGAAFLGGVLIMFGARLADGCTSGNGISGSLQLAVGGWTFFLTLFASGIATCLVLFGHGRKEGGS